nr:MAG TPA: hypothetical protein [Microviridae sp.]
MYQKQYYGIVVFKKFFGIKAGRSVWKQCTYNYRYVSKTILWNRSF